MENCNTSILKNFRIYIWTTYGTYDYRDSLLYFGQDWTLNLPYLKELPKGKCICQFDDSTDIFKAQEILSDHLCIMGNVKQPLLTIGTPHEVEAYCKRLIDIVGHGGGYILSTTIIPPDAKFENVKIMLDIAKNYYPY